MKRLYLTEKGSQITALKKIIKDKNATFAPLAGHLYRLLEANEYDKSFNDWYDAVVNKKVPFIPKEFKKQLSETKNGTNYRKMFQEVKKAIEACDEIVIASDPDNEGASLAMEVIEACKAQNKVKGMMNMAATDPATLSKSLKEFEENPSKIDYVKMAKASESRAMYDWSYGMNLTMTSTVTLGKGDVFHMGGVKTPTLRMIVERDLEIENFKEEEFFKFKGIARDNKTGLEFPVELKYDGKDRTFDKNLADDIMKNMPKTISVSKYAEEQKISIPPKPFSLLDMAASVSRTNGMSMVRSENAAQSLYDKGYISYPRTEERYYSSGEHKQSRQVISSLQSHSFFSSLPELNTPYKKRSVFSDAKLVGKAHGALSPTTKYCNLASLTDDEKIVYMAIAKRYYSQFMEDYSYNNISLEAKEDKYNITFTENVMLNAGWKSIYPNTCDDEIRSIPSFNKGEELTIVSMEMIREVTQPKPRFTELSLAQAMENIANIYDDEKIKEYLGESGIGTPATRKKIIQDLKEEKIGFKKIEPYIIIEKGKVISTQKARDLIEITPEEISSPIVRANLEKMLNEVVVGTKKVEEIREIIVKDITKMCEGIVNVGLENNIKPYNMLAFDKPTEKQLEYVLGLAKHNNLEVPKEVLEDKVKIAEWIDDNMDNIRFTLSEKQREILNGSEDPKVQKLLNEKDYNKIDFGFLTTSVKNQMKENKKDYRYNISDKQKDLLLKPENNVDEKLIKLISEKSEFTIREYNKIQKEIKRIFDEIKQQKYGKNKSFSKPKKTFYKKTEKSDDFGR